MTVDQAVQAVEEKGPLPVVETGGTEAPALAQHRDGSLVHQHIDQHGGASHQAHIVFEVGLLQLGVQGFDRRRTDLHSDAHGSILLFRYDRNVYGEIHPVAHGHQFCISNSFSEDLYSIQYAWKKGEHPKRGEFSPDFFIKQGDRVFVVEIKGDEEISDPSSENVKKHEFAVEHFQRLNEWLQKDGSATRYQFNMLTPRGYGIFFTKLRAGELAGFRSELDVAMARATVGG
jgi:hypothetical protein